jgi:hypothetical protein
MSLPQALVEVPVPAIYTVVEMLPDDDQVSGQTQV